MKVTLENTSKVIELRIGEALVPARIWEGTTNSGIKVHAFITRIAIDRDEQRTEEFERELKETATPTAEIMAIPLRLIL